MEPHSIYQTKPFPLLSSLCQYIMSLFIIIKDIFHVFVFLHSHNRIISLDTTWTLDRLYRYGVPHSVPIEKAGKQDFLDMITRPSFNKDIISRKTM